MRFARVSILAAAASLVAAPTLARAAQPALSAPLATTGYSLEQRTATLDLAKGTSSLTAYAQDQQPAPAPEKKSKTGKYVAIGVGVLAVLALVVVLGAKKAVDRANEDCCDPI